jgi:sugar/nucleoside kinase (ribokinase family)
MAAPRFAFDVVGIGAVNLDVIVTAAAVGAGSEQVRARLEQLVAGAGAGALEWGAESFVDESTVAAAVEAVGASSLDVTLGGSAFNTVVALATLRRGLRLGYVGVAGQVPVPGLSSLALLARLGVDHEHVRADRTRSCGLCFSFAADGERTLLTSPGANVGLADLIDTRFGALTGYLAAARIVHLAAPLDDRSPARLLDLVRAVRRASPETLLTFDPGHGWSTVPAPAVHELVRASDLVLLNQREFAALGGAGLVQQSDTGRLVIIVKRPDGVLCCRLRAGAVELQPLTRPPLPATEIRDPTGAGDMFAAGLLAVLAANPPGDSDGIGAVDRDRAEAGDRPGDPDGGRPGDSDGIGAVDRDRAEAGDRPGDSDSIRLGSLLGIELARHKLRYVGTQRHADLPEIARAFLSTHA